MQAKRQLKKVCVNYISLVTEGANNKTIIYKSIDNELNNNFNKIIEIKKINDELKVVYGIVYSPDEVDLHGDTATAEVIREMAYDFMKNARTNNIDKQHNFIANEGFVCESWLLKANDYLFENEKEGSWAVGIKIENENTWQQIKAGIIKGLSMSGIAEVIELNKIKGDTMQEQDNIKTETINNSETNENINSEVNENIKKEGRTLSSKNKKRIENALKELQQIINELDVDDDAEKIDESMKPVEKKIDINEILTELNLLKTKVDNLEKLSSGSKQMPNIETQKKWSWI